MSKPVERVVVSSNANDVMNYLTEKNDYVTSKQMTEDLGLKGVEIRKAVHELRTKGFLICSNHLGYWKANNIKEVDATISHLDSRIEKLIKARDGLKGGRVAYAE